MARKPRPRPKQPTPAGLEDTAAHSLSKDDRNRLGMDSWEPSLLRKLLTAQNRLRKR